MAIAWVQAGEGASLGRHQRIARGRPSIAYHWMTKSLPCGGLGLAASFCAGADHRLSVRRRPVPERSRLGRPVRRLGGLRDPIRARPVRGGWGFRPLCASSDWGWSTPGSRGREGCRREAIGAPTSSDTSVSASSCECRRSGRRSSVRDRVRLGKAHAHQLAADLRLVSGQVVVVNNDWVGVPPLSLGRARPVLGRLTVFLASSLSSAGRISTTPAGEVLRQSVEFCVWDLCVSTPSPYFLSPRVERENRGARKIFQRTERARQGSAPSVPRRPDDRDADFRLENRTLLGAMRMRTRQGDFPIRGPRARLSGGPGDADHSLPLCDPCRAYLI